MKSITRFLLLIEVFVCFAPVCYAWLLGVVGLLFLAPAANRVEGAVLLPLFGWAIVLFFGGLGIVGAYSLLILVRSNRAILSLAKIKLFLMFGLVATAIAIFFSVRTSQAPVNWVVFLLPALATIHLGFLARNRLSLSPGAMVK